MASSTPKLNLIAQDWRVNKVTTTERLAISSSLGSVNKFLIVYDTTLLSQFMWDGAAWQPFNPLAPGGGGSTEFLKKTFVAGESIGGGQVVMLTGNKVYKFITTNSANYQTVVGVSNQAANLNDNIDVILQGVCNQVGGLVAGVVYFASSTAGLLSAVAPSTGIVQVVGVAENSTSIIVALEKPYIKI